MQPIENRVFRLSHTFSRWFIVDFLVSSFEVKQAYEHTHTHTHVQVVVMVMHIKALEITKFMIDLFLFLHQIKTLFALANGYTCYK